MYRVLKPVYLFVRRAINGSDLYSVEWEEVGYAVDMQHAKAQFPRLHGPVLERVVGSPVEAQ